MDATISRFPSARALFAVEVDVDRAELQHGVRDRAAERMREFLPDGSEVIRTGGGLAAVVPVPVGEAEHVARMLARRMMTVLREPYRMAAGHERARPSVGIVCVRSDEPGAFTETLHRAQVALERARMLPVEPIAFDRASVGPPVRATAA